MFIRSSQTRFGFLPVAITTRSTARNCDLNLKRIDRYSFLFPRRFLLQTHALTYLATVIADTLSFSSYARIEIICPSFAGTV